MMKILLNPFVIFLSSLHIFANLSTCVERWSDGQSCSDVLWRLPLGFVVIFVFYFAGISAGRFLAKRNIL